MAGLLAAALPLQAGSLAGAYADPRCQTAIWFGAFSHYMQPWRGYLETVPAGVYTNAIGINFISSDPFTQCDLVARMLARNGARQDVAEDHAADAARKDRRVQPHRRDANRFALAPPMPAVNPLCESGGGPAILIGSD